MERPRAADDFEVIRERLEELRREREEIESANTSERPAGGSGGGESEGEPQQDEHCGAPWVPTIFLPQPTD